jgi:3-oxoacyl-[acyl-carrier protein] reductase
VTAAVERAVGELGGLDVLINNAGVIRDNLLFKMTDDDWDTVIGVHLKGSFLCARAAQKHMVDNRWGKIVNLSSTSALGNRGQTNYSTAKAGLQGMTKTLAIELGPFGINVNAVAPGFIDTEMTRAVAVRVGVDPEERKAATAKMVPLRRVGVPEDIAGVVSFLCGPDSSYVTGQVIYVAGGPRA